MKNSFPLIIALGLICVSSSCELSLQDESSLIEHVADACLDKTINIDHSKFHRKVLIIGIDGCRPDMIKPGLAPFLFEFATKRSTFFTNHHEVQQTPYSGPNWSSILTGVNQGKHGVVNNKFKNHRLAVYPHVFELLERADSSKRTVSLVHWSPINNKIVQHKADLTNPFGVADEEVFRWGKKIISNPEMKPADLMFLHFVELDAAGHAHGFHPQTPEYVDVLRRLDGYVKELVFEIEKMRELGEDWLILIVSDHGGEGTGHIYRENENTGRTIFFANHPAIYFRRTYRTAQTDLVPTIFDFMGIHSTAFNCYTDGQSIIVRDF